MFTIQYSKIHIQPHILREKKKNNKTTNISEHFRDQAKKNILLRCVHILQAFDLQLGQKATSPCMIKIKNKILMGLVFTSIRKSRVTMWLYEGSRNVDILMKTGQQSNVQNIRSKHNKRVHRNRQPKSNEGEWRNINTNLFGFKAHKFSDLFTL